MANRYRDASSAKLVEMIRRYYRAANPVTCARGHALCGCSANPADENTAPCSRKVREEQERRARPAPAKEETQQQSEAA